MMYPALKPSVTMSGPHPALRRLQDGVRKVIASDTTLLLNRLRNKNKTDQEKAEKVASERRLEAAAREEADRLERQRIIKEIFHKEPCPYSHPVFHYAAQIFAVLEHPPRSDNPTLWRHQEQMQKQKIEEIPTFDFESDTEKRLTFNLVFSTLKYQRFLEDMLEDCSFFSQYPEFREASSVVMVILCDYQQRKFQLRTTQKEEKLDPHLSEIESAIYKCKTKLNAALARSRIKSGVLSIDHLLPESVRSNDKIGSSMHVYAWVNQVKTDWNSVEEELSSDGFMLVESAETLTAKQYSRDYHCHDLLFFAAQQREYLEQHFLVESGHLVIQDKSSCVGPHSAKSLINEGDDIMHINIGSGLTTAHLASLTQGSDSVIYGFGVNSEKHNRSVMAQLDKLGAKSRVKIIQESFLEADLHDERLKHIKVVLVTADCSRSGVANPVNFIVNEGEDMSILSSLSLGRPDDNQLSELMVKHSSILKHALKFPRVQALVYTSRSLFDAENESVIMRSLEYINTMQQKKTPFRVAPPVVPLSQKDIESENPLVGKYLRFMPSNHMSGCFVSAVTREADDPKEAAKDILARAAARGIISGVPTVKDKEKAKNKGRKKSKEKDKSARKKSPPRSPKKPKEARAGPPGVGQSNNLQVPPDGNAGSATSLPQLVGDKKPDAAPSKETSGGSPVAEMTETKSLQPGKDSDHKQKNSLQNGDKKSDGSTRLPAIGQAGN